jgi:activator of HSP90 ATPase
MKSFLEFFICSAMTKTIETSKTFLVPPRVLYHAFLDAKDLSRMLMSPATMDGRVGGTFSYFAGGVTGKVVRLEPVSTIVEDWRFSQWSDDCFSTLELTFNQAGENRTILSVQQSGIPEADKHGNGNQDQLVLNGWNDRFFMGLEKVLGFPVDRD